MNSRPPHIKHLLFTDCKGVALIIVIAITGIVSLTIGVMMTQYIAHRYSIKTTIEKLQSFYTAEAGIKKALYNLTKDPTKGINWLISSRLQDAPLEEKVFYQNDATSQISTVNDCGFLHIRSKTKGRFPKTIEVLAAGEVPDSLQYNLYLMSPKPLILPTGSQLGSHSERVKIKLNQELVLQGGTIDGVKEIGVAPFPAIKYQPFANSIFYFNKLLSSPKDFETELFSPQIFSPGRPFPDKKIFVNDAILIENRNLDSLWYAGSDITLVSTAEVQISGTLKMNNVTIVATGAIKLLDQADLRSSRIYSMNSIELRENARFSGVLIAPEIIISGKAQLLNPSIVYCGPPFNYSKMIFDNELPAYCCIINCSPPKKGLIDIFEQAKIEGFIYSIVPVRLRGEVRGFVYCQGFFDEPVTQDTTNTNVLAGTIKPPKSLESISIPIVFQEIRNFRIFRWQEF